MYSTIPDSPPLRENQRPRTPQHVPKLSYRNANPNRVRDFAQDAISNKSTTSVPPALAPGASSQANHGPNTKAFGLPSKYTCPSGSRRNAEKVIASPETPTETKKKNSSVFGFLTAKEPSTQAWLDYQDSLRKQQLAQRGRVSAVGMPMVSSTKLPPTVPKVNSKWDGVPEPIAQRDKERKAAEREAHRAQVKLLYDGITGGASVRSRSSSHSIGSRKLPHSTQTSLTSLLVEPQGSSSSAASSRTDLPCTPASIDESDSPSIFGNSLHSAPQTPHSDISAFMPTLPGATMLPDEPSKTPQAFRFEVPEVPKLTISPTIPGNKPLPLTPQHSLPLYASASTTHNANSMLSASEGQTTIPSLPSSEFVVLRSSGTNVLGPPMSAQRKAKAAPSLANDASEYQPPMSQPSSILKKDATPRKLQASTRPPMSAYFSTSKSSTNSRSDGTKDRTIAPWELSNDKHAQISRDEAERSITPTPHSTRRACRKGRLPFFKS